MEKMIGDKMVIKIKIPKLSDVTMEGEKTPEQDVIGILSSKTEAKKVCLECNKEFSSGKALGGHMRVHVQSANHHKNPNLQKPPKTSKINNNGDAKPYYMNSVNEEGKPTCSQCGKTFPSMKSLFGHMRCHPERVWRGILPPPNTTNTPNTPTASAARRREKSVNNSSASGCSSTSSENDLTVSDGGGGGDHQVVDLTKFLRGWTVTERRGRSALKPPAEDEDDAVLLEAVEDLMSLANGNVNVNVNVNGVGSMTGSVITQRQLLKLEATEGHDVNPSPPARQQELNAGDDEYSDGRNNTNLKSPYKIKKRKKIKLMMELEPETKTEQNDVVPTPSPPVPELQECKYKCTTCNKCFATHQALGGHRSSHNKPKLTSSDRHEETDNHHHHRGLLLNLFSGESSEKEGGIAGGGFSVHQCKICDKIFATGQALGGHQRCHWSGGMISINVAQPAHESSQITSAGEEGSQTGSGRRVLDFDLNEVPPVAGVMEEDEGTGSGSGNNGYDASSSYNSNMC